MAIHTEAKESRTVGVNLDHGVLVATIRSKSLLFELAINEIEDQILEALPQAKCALLVDCDELTLHVSSQFLSMLVRVHRKANDVGLKMGICNLSEALRMVYNVTALHSVLPAYESRSHGVAELGEIDVWERQLGERESEPTRTNRRIRWPRTCTAIVLSAALAACGAVATTTWMHRSQADSAKASAPRFRSSIGGEIRYTSGSQSASDAHATVVVWPVDGSRQKLSQADLRRVEENGWTDLRGEVAVGCADREGHFELPMFSQEEVSNYYMLVISNSVDREQSIPAHERLVLDDCLEDTDEILDKRGFVLTRIQVLPDRRTAFHWTFIKNDSPK